MSHLSSRRCTIATTVLLLHFFLSVCTAHMVMSEPPPINYKTNPYYSTAKADFDYTSPLTQSGSNYPCKGHLKDYNAPEGQSVRNYAPGGTYDLKIDGSAVHGGGSCQASLSFDGGNTWTVIKSWIGDCPHASGGTQDFTFTIPAGTPSGKAVFAWTWFNQIGNREMYMNCAVVTITGSKKNRLKRALSGPNVFVANIGNGCSTTAGTDLVFPDSGTDIQYAGDPSKRAGPAGTCSAKQYTGGGATVTTGGTGGSSSGTGGENPSNSGAASSAVGGSSGGSSGNQGLYTQTTTVGAGTGYYTPPAGGQVPAPSSYPGSGTGTGTGTSTGGTDTGGTSSGNSGTGNSGTVVDGNLGKGCGYWKSQGYICSDASILRSSMRAGWIWGLVGGWVLMAVVWTR